MCDDGQAGFGQRVDIAHNRTSCGLKFSGKLQSGQSPAILQCRQKFATVVMRA
jgi:hypothetical protein